MQIALRAILKGESKLSPGVVSLGCSSTNPLWSACILRFGRTSSTVAVSSVKGPVHPEHRHSLCNCAGTVPSLALSDHSIRALMPISILPIRPSNGMPPS